MGYAWGIHWDDIVLLYIYKKGSTYITELTEKVTKHPQRTYRVIHRLEGSGLIRSEYCVMTTPDNKPLGIMRIITLTDKGKKYVEDKLLPKLRELLDKIPYIDNGKTS